LLHRGNTVSSKMLQTHAARSGATRTRPAKNLAMSCLSADPHCVQYRVDHKYPIESRLTGLPQLGHFLLPGLCNGGLNQAISENLSPDDLRHRLYHVYRGPRNKAGRPRAQTMRMLVSVRSTSTPLPPLLGDDWETQRGSAPLHAPVGRACHCRVDRAKRNPPPG
jgi:hypothetical protein